MEPTTVERTKLIEGGYTILTPTILCNLLAICQSGRITYRAVRTFLSLILMDAIRRAAKKSSGRRSGKEQWIEYKLEEIERRVGGVGGSYIREDLRTLKQSGLLLDFTPSQIRINPLPLDCSLNLLNAVNGGRSPSRPIPVPRRILEFLTSCSKPSLLKTAIAYILRGLSFYRDGAINPKGSVKSSLVARVTGLSTGAVKKARRLLIELGWLSKDPNSKQCKLNRTGAYFTIDTAWEAPKEEGNQTEQLPTSDAPPKRERFFDPAPKSKTLSKLPPLKPEKGGKLTPPIKYYDLQRKFKDQKTGSPTPSGVKENSKKEPSKIRSLPKVSILNVRREDIENSQRFEALYRDAVERKLIEHSEANVLNFIGAAVRARLEAHQGRGDAVKIFCVIVRRGLWSHITQKHEDIARECLNHQRKRNPNSYRIDPTPTKASSSDGKTFMECMLNRLVQAVSMPETSPANSSHAEFS